MCGSNRNSPTWTSSRQLLVSLRAFGSSLFLLVVVQRQQCSQRTNHHARHGSFEALRSHYLSHLKKIYILTKCHLNNKSWSHGGIWKLYGYFTFIISSVYLLYANHWAIVTFDVISYSSKRWNGNEDSTMLVEKNSLIRWRDDRRSFDDCEGMCGNVYVWHFSNQESIDLPQGNNQKWSSASQYQSYQSQENEWLRGN